LQIERIVPLCSVATLRATTIADIRSKREFVSNALAMFRWAAGELGASRSVGSFDASGKLMKQLEMPVINALAAARHCLNQRMPTPEQSDALAAQPGRPMSEFMAELNQKLKDLELAQDHHQTSGVREHA